MSTWSGNRMEDPPARRSGNRSRHSPEEGREMVSANRIRGLAAAAAVLAASVAIAACGSSGIESGGGGAGKSTTVKIQGKPSGSLTISNWPLYIDKKTVPDFEKATGVQVKY